MLDFSLFPQKIRRYYTTVNAFLTQEVQMGIFLNDTETFGVGPRFAIIPGHKHYQKFLSDTGPNYTGPNQGYVKNVEGVYVGQGLTTLYVQNEWNHDFKLSRKEQLIHTLTGGSGANDTWSNEKEENRTGVVDLNFSKVESDLLFEIDKDKVAVFQADPDVLGG